MAKRKNRQRSIYLAFEFHKDKQRCHTFMGQARQHCQFKLKDWSLPEAEPTEEWRRRARPRIRKSDVLIVLLGPDTHNANGVLDELGLAGGVKCPIVQLMPQKRKYGLVSEQQAVMRYKWKNLNKLLADPKSYIAAMRQQDGG